MRKGLRGVTSRIARLYKAQGSQNGDATAGLHSQGELVPFKGHAAHRNPIRFVEPLSDDDLIELNALLDWKAFVVDSQGRRFGNAAWRGKRTEPQAIPDPRVVQMHERFDLSDKHVLEVGCFEGIHTVGISALARRVTAVDSRIENVVKTVVRCAFFGHYPTVFKCDLEARPLNSELLASDVLHHVGVLYHLKDPAQHLLDLKEFVRLGIMLDTHYAEEEEATETYASAGKEFRYKKFQESGYEDPFSGMFDHSKWLLLDDIVALIKEAGFGRVEIAEKRAERNGPRVLLFARND